MVLVGRFGAAQGVRGEVRIKSFTQDPLAIGSYGPLTDGDRDFHILRVRALREDMVVAAIAGVTDRDAAEALTGRDLYARRENMPPPDEDEFYVADLIGMAAVDETGANVGEISDVLDHGAGNVLEIRPEAGGDTILVPFTKGFAPDLDLGARRVTVIVPPDGKDEA